MGGEDSGNEGVKRSEQDRTPRLHCRPQSHEFEKNSRKEEEDASTSTPTSTRALVTADEKSAQAAAKTADQLCDDARALFVKKFGKFMKKNSNPNFNKNNHKNDSNTNLKCLNCDRYGHFAADCWRPRIDDKKPADKNSKEGRRSFRRNKE